MTRPTREEIALTYSLDVETTGLDPFFAEIREIAWSRRRATMAKFRKDDVVGHTVCERCVFVMTSPTHGVAINVCRRSVVTLGENWRPGPLCALLYRRPSKRRAAELAAGEAERKRIVGALDELHRREVALGEQVPPNSQERGYRMLRAGAFLEAAEIVRALPVPAQEETK